MHCSVPDTRFLHHNQTGCKQRANVFFAWKSYKKPLGNYAENAIVLKLIQCNIL